MTKFFFIRHGQSLANSKFEVALADSPLTDSGESQAKFAASQLSDKNIAVIATSPFLRAKATAEIIAAELKITDVNVIDELRERGFGNLEGGTNLLHLPFWFYTVEGGQKNIETRDALIARCQVALAKIKELSRRGMVLAVGHAIEGFYLQQVAAGKNHFEEFERPQRLANAEIVEINF